MNGYRDAGLETPLFPASQAQWALYMQPEKIEIAEIGTELRKLARSGVLTRRTADACAQAAWLLERMREVIVTGPSDTVVVETLKQILAEQGEG